MIAARIETAEVLRAIEDLLERSRPAVLRAASLRPPADLEERRTLARALGRESLPRDLDQLFAWHDGERNASFLENSSDLGGWRLLSTAEALALMRDAPTWPAQHWKSTYVPILDSGGGDLGMFETSTGAIEVWCHDGDPPFVCTQTLGDLLQISLDAWRRRLASDRLT